MIYASVILGMAVTLVIAYVVLICIGTPFLLTGVGDFYGLPRG